MVLLAMGFLGPERYIVNELALEQDPRSNVATSSGRYATSVPRVFAAGGNAFPILANQWALAVSIQSQIVDGDSRWWCGR